MNQCYSLTEEISEKLRKVLDGRNYLTHKYFKLHIGKFYSELGQLEMLKYFCDFIDDAKELDSDLSDYYKKYTDRMGMTSEKIAQLVSELKQEELRRVDSIINQ